jgi:putative ABC transport system permease protein
MSLFNLLRIALKALQRNKLRAFLTMLGIIIGVGAVIAMVAIGQGSKQSIQSALSGMGSNMIIVRPNSNISAGARLDATSVQTLTLEDVKALQKEAPDLSAVTTGLRRSRVSTPIISP